MLPIIILVILFVIFLIIFIYLNGYSIEGLAGNESCPDMLIQQGTKYLLYNTYKSESDTNPIKFDNLTQYAEYVKKEADNGNICPILFVQQVLGAQGDTTYKIRNDPLNPQDVDYKSQSSSELKIQDNYKTPYTRQIYMDNLASNIVNNLTTNEISNIDKLELTKSILAQTQPPCTPTPDDIKPLEINGLTADPMSQNWGGPEFTDKIINQGYYAGNEVIKSTKGSTN